MQEKFFSRLLSSLLFCFPECQGGVCLRALLWQSSRKQFQMEMKRPNLCLLGKVLCKSCVWIRLLALCVAVNYILSTPGNSRKIPCVHPNLKGWKRSVILDEVEVRTGILWVKWVVASPPVTSTQVLGFSHESSTHKESTPGRQEASNLRSRAVLTTGPFSLSCFSGRVSRPPWHLAYDGHESLLCTPS